MEGALFQTHPLCKRNIDLKSLQTIFLDTENSNYIFFMSLATTINPLMSRFLAMFDFSREFVVDNSFIRVVKDVLQPAFLTLFQMGSGMTLSHGGRGLFDHIT